MTYDGKCIIHVECECNHALNARSFSIVLTAAMPKRRRPIRARMLPRVGVTSRTVYKECEGRGKLHIPNCANSCVRRNWSRDSLSSLPRQPNILQNGEYNTHFVNCFMCFHCKVKMKCSAIMDYNCVLMSFPYFIL